MNFGIIKVLFCFNCVLLNVTASCQEWVYEQGDKEFLSRMSGGLRVGDIMPGIPLGEVFNNYTGKSNFSEFRGQLVILDFWSTNCTSCIEGFAKMERLQKQFGSRIQIILVNKYETLEEIQKVFKLRTEMAKKNGDSLSYNLPNLPLIVSNIKLPESSLSEVQAAFKRSSNYVIDTLFPIRGVPHHVWIDGSGVVRVRGGSETTHAQKIENVLSGKEIFSKNDENTTIRVQDQNWPYFKIVSHMQKTAVKFSSIISPFNNQYAAKSGGYSRDIMDKDNNTKRNTYINWEILRIYYFGPFHKFFQERGKDILLSPPNVFSYKLFDLQVKDTLRYTTSFLKNQTGSLTDWDDIKSKICYEQIVPINMNEEDRLKLMLSDLNNYLKLQYSAEVGIEKKKILCYVLVRTSGADKLRPIERGYEPPQKLTKDGVIVYKFNQTALARCFLLSCQNSPLEQTLGANRKAGLPFFLVNDTGFEWDRKIDITLPCGSDLQSIEQLRQVLNLYDLDIQVQERELDFVVIKEGGV